VTRSPSARPAAVVFDLDGTLLDTMTLAPTVYADTIHALGGPDVSPSDVVAAWHIGPTPTVLAHFLGRPASVEDIECFYRHFEAAGAAARPFPGVVEMVDTLGRAGYRLGIFTSATRRAATLMLCTAGLDGVFPTVICGDEISEPKPAPEGLWLACQYLGVSAAATAYVGDAEVDLQCAEIAGSVAVHARWGATTTAAEDFPLVAYRPSDVIELLLRQAFKGIRHTQARE
jgi:HAD superfamily hydrolase (TIGR01549 family)